MDRYIVTREEIEACEGLAKTHFLNENAQRTNKSLGDITGLTGLGFHIIEVAPGRESTETHMHYYEDECVYILEGEAEAAIGSEKHPVKSGDFIGYRAGGEAHQLKNTGPGVLKCIVVGQRLGHDVGDYPLQNKRLYRNQACPGISSTSMMSASRRRVGKFEGFRFGARKAGKQWLDVPARPCAGTQPTHAGLAELIHPRAASALRDLKSLNRPGINSRNTLMPIHTHTELVTTAMRSQWSRYRAQLLMYLKMLPASTPENSLSSS